MCQSSGGDEGREGGILAGVIRRGCPRMTPSDALQAWKPAPRRIPIGIRGFAYSTPSGLTRASVDNLKECPSGAVRRISPKKARYPLSGAFKLAWTVFSASTFAG